MRKKDKRGCGWALPIGLSLMVNLLLFSFFGLLFNLAAPRTTVYEVSLTRPSTLVVADLNPVKSMGAAKTAERKASPQSSLLNRNSAGKKHSSASASIRHDKAVKPVLRGPSSRGEVGENRKLLEGMTPALGGDLPAADQSSGGGSAGPSAEGGSVGGNGSGPAAVGNQDGGGGTSSEEGWGPQEIREPVVLSRTPPPYPSEAREEGVEGTAILEVLLAESGRINHVRTHRSSGDPRLDRAAEEAVKNWRFSPRLRRGVPEEARLSIQISFQLR
jgi:protein TonB